MHIEILMLVICGLFMLIAVGISAVAIERANTRTIDVAREQIERLSREVASKEAELQTIKSERVSLTYNTKESLENRIAQNNYAIKYANDIYDTVAINNQLIAQATEKLNRELAAMNELSRRLRGAENGMMKDLPADGPFIPRVSNCNDSAK